MNHSHQKTIASARHLDLVCSALPTHEIPYMSLGTPKLALSNNVKNLHKVSICSAKSGREAITHPLLIASAQARKGRKRGDVADYSLIRQIFQPPSGLSRRVSHRRSGETLVLGDSGGRQTCPFCRNAQDDALFWLAECAPILSG